MLSVTLVGDFSICLNPKVLHNSKYFFALSEVLSVHFTMFLLFSLTNVLFSHKLIFKSPSICHSSFKIFTVFKIFTGLHIIPAVIGFVFGIRNSIKMFSISFEMQFLALKQILLLT